MKVIIGGKKEKSDLYIIIYTFILIFAPPVLPRINFILALYSICLILVNYRKQVVQIMYRSGMYIWLLLMISLPIYGLTITCINGVIYDDIINLDHYIHLYNRFIALTIVMIPCCTYMIAYLKKKNYTQHQFVELIINAGLIETFLTLISFAIPPVKSIFIMLMSKFGGSELMENTWYITVRSYGFAGTLVDLFGLAMGIIAGISLFYGMTEKKKYIFYSILIMVAGMLNARTTIVIYAISIILTLLFMLKKMNLKYAIQSIIGLIIMIIAIRILLEYLYTCDNPTTNWIKTGIDDLISMISGEKQVNKKQGFAYFLTSKEWWQLPKEFFRLFFGTGHSKYGADGYSHSDTGYVNDIWFIGIFGVFIIYGSIIYLNIKNCIYSTSTQQKFISFFLIASFLIFNIKGSALGYNPGAAVIFLVMYEIAYFDKVKNIRVDISKNKMKIQIE